MQTLNLLHATRTHPEIMREAFVHSERHLIKHRNDKADTCPHHRRFADNLVEVEQHAMSAYVPVSIHNPLAMIADGWPAILDWTPDSGVDRNHPDYVAAWNQ